MSDNSAIESTESTQPQSGLSFEQAISSTPEVWREKLIKEGYKGNATRSSQFMNRLCEGMGHQYNVLQKRGKIQEEIVPPRVDFDNLPERFGIVYLTEYNTIVVPTRIMQSLDHLSLDDD